MTKPFPNIYKLCPGIYAAEAFPDSVTRSRSVNKSGRKLHSHGFYGTKLNRPIWGVAMSALPARCHNLPKVMQIFSRLCQAHDNGQWCSIIALFDRRDQQRCNYHKLEFT